MFRCQVSGKVSQRYEKPVRIVIQTRTQTYTDEKGRVIGEGTEIVKEKSVLPSVAEKLARGEKL